MKGTSLIVLPLAVLSLVAGTACTSKPTPTPTPIAFQQATPPASAAAAKFKPGDKVVYTGAMFAEPPRGTVSGVGYAPTLGWTYKLSGGEIITEDFLRLDS